MKRASSKVRLLTTYVFLCQIGGGLKEVHVPQFITLCDDVEFSFNPSIRATAG